MEPFAWTPSRHRGDRAGIGGPADRRCPEASSCRRFHYGTVTSCFFPRSPFRWRSTFVSLQQASATGAPTQRAKWISVVASRRDEDRSRLNALAENLANATCTPFLGSGASAPHIPTGRELAADWARRFGYPFPDTENLARVMQFVATTTYSGDADSLKQRVVSEHFDKSAEPDFTAPHQVHRVLAECQLPLYVTTNYDDFMFRALEQTAERRPRRDISPWYGPGPHDGHPPSPVGRGGYRPSADEPLVFHLHGHRNLARSLLLTEDDNIDYLVREAGDSRSRGRPYVIPRYIRGQLRTTPLLFLGYSLQDWTFHVLFRRLLEGANKRNHVSVQFDPAHAATAPACLYWEQYLRSQNIWVFWETTETFMRKLVTRLRRMRGDGRP